MSANGIHEKEQVYIRAGDNARDLPAARWLKALLIKGLGGSKAATLSIHVDVSVPAAERGQIDLVLQGFLLPPWTSAVEPSMGLEVTSLVIKSVIATIEVKNHFKQNINLTAASAMVNNQENGQPHSVTEQSEKQLFALKQLIKRELRWGRDPWLGRLIFFPKLTEADLPAEPHFYLAADTTYDTLMRRLCVSAIKTTPKRGRNFSLDSFRALDEEELKRKHEQLHGLLGRFIWNEKSRSGTATDELKHDVPSSVHVSNAKYVSSNPGYAAPKPSIAVVEEVPVTRVAAPYAFSVRQSMQEIGAWLYSSIVRLSWHLPGIRGMFVFAVVILVLVGVLAIIALRSTDDEIAPIQERASRIKVCGMRGEQENCSADLIFHRGETVSLHILAAGRSVTSARVITANRKNIVLLSKYNPVLQEDVINYEVPHKAAIGTYSFVVDLQVGEDQRHETMTQRFVVVR